MSDVTSRARAALATFRATASPAQVARVDELLQTAHTQTAAVLRAGEGTVDHPELARMLSTVSDAELPSNAATPVGNDGTLWGFGTYEQLDPGWIEAGTLWLTEGRDLADFANDPAVFTMPNQVTIAIAGDWGTGYYEDDTPAEGVANAMSAAAPQITVHLGDEYYAGTPDEEQSKLVDLWPGGTLASFALNSNHGMYYGARGYFGTTLAAPAFAAQQGTSFFALVNDDWLIFGLDSAYNASWDSMFMDGALGSLQQGWMARTQAAYPGRKIIVMTHHTGTDLTGATKTSLWQEVVDALGKSPDYWYWGHAHNAVVYNDIDGCLARCNGHGAIPFGVASSLQPAVGGTVDWFEDGLAGDTRIPDRCLNGAAIVALDGTSITETFLSETGETRWSS